MLRLPRAWNKTPVAPDKLAREDLRIVHFLMTWKPWRYTDIPYQEYFWEYAKKTDFYEFIIACLNNHGVEGLEKDQRCEANLQALARSETERNDGYFKVYGKRYGRLA